MDFFLGDWGRLGAVADEAGHARGVTDDVPGFVGEAHFNQDVTLEDFAVDDFALAVFDFDAFFFWDDGVEDFAVELVSVNAFLKAAGDFVFVAAVGADCVPRAGVIITVYCHNFSPFDYLSVILR